MTPVVVSGMPCGRRASPSIQHQRISFDGDPGITSLAPNLAIYGCLAGASVLHCTNAHAAVIFPPSRTVYTVLLPSSLCFTSPTPLSRKPQHRPSSSSVDACIASVTRSSRVAGTCPIPNLRHCHPSD
ncbi:hypothetical protein BD309DRAFT_958519 [Dichomitus squalens]|nr:hypothetical protein BD309DRAFT_958519 [Dichomitus squalens]